MAEKLEISDFVASNCWLEKFKLKYSMCNKTVAGEAGDVSKETMVSWNKRVREITTGWDMHNVWTVFKHHHLVFAKKHHFQITATRFWYNRQLEGPLQKANAAVRLLSS